MFDRNKLIHVLHMGYCSTVPTGRCTTWLGTERFTRFWVLRQISTDTVRPWDQQVPNSKNYIFLNFQWRAERHCENEIYSQYQNYLELTKKHILYSTRKRYEKRFNTSNREERAKMDTLKNVLDRRARNADRKMEELMNTKKEEVNQIIRRHMKILGNRTTWYRDYYVVNILYPSMGIHVDP